MRRLLRQQMAGPGGVPPEPKALEAALERISAWSGERFGESP